MKRLLLISLIMSSAPLLYSADDDAFNAIENATDEVLIAELYSGLQDWKPAQDAFIAMTIKAGMEGPQHLDRELFYRTQNLRSRIPVLLRELRRNHSNLDSEGIRALFRQANLPEIDGLEIAMAQADV